MPLRYAVISSLIGLGFLIIAILNFLNTGGSDMAGMALIRSVVGGFGLFWLQVAAFLLALALIYGLVGWLVAWLGQAAAEKLIAREDDRHRAVFLIFLLVHLWIILENAAQFPASAMGEMLHDAATLPAVRWVVLGLATMTGLILAFGALIRLFQATPAIQARKRRSVAALVAVSVLLGGWYWLDRPADSPFPIDESRPHVVLVGIDGWRADMVPQWGGEPGRMPFTEAFIDQSAYFEEAVTPHARSFPAWWTILSGQYPATHGARFNLIDESMITSQADLPIQLGSQGYHRIFAIDERRFAPIREAHGFDEVVGPGIGAADFLVGGLNDTPLGNLIVNSRAGRWLFPFSHANRAVDELYSPETFDTLLSRTLEKAPRQPLFFATHFELPHWPYTWADGPSDKYHPHPFGIDYARYLETLERVDQQIESLFNDLERLGILDNALVVILSDHGETFPNEDTAWQHASSDARYDPPYGHGTSVLDLKQNRVPVAFRWFGRESFPPGMRRGRISLADIYPTLADAINIEPGHDLDGRSLLSALSDKDVALESRPIPLETGLSIDDIGSGITTPQRLLSMAVGYYHINIHGLVQFRPEFARSVIVRKKRAVLMDNFIATPFVVEGTDPFIAWRFASIDRGEYWDEAAPIPSDSPQSILTTEFCKLFSNDMEYLPETLCTTTRTLSNHDK